MLSSAPETAVSLEVAISVLLREFYLLRAVFGRSLHPITRHLPDYLSVADGHHSKSGSSVLV